ERGGARRASPRQRAGAELPGRRRASQDDRRPSQARQLRRLALLPAASADPTPLEHRRVTGERRERDDEQADDGVAVGYDGDPRDQEQCRVDRVVNGRETPVATPEEST